MFKNLFIKVNKLNKKKYKKNKKQNKKLSKMLNKNKINKRQNN